VADVLDTVWDWLVGMARRNPVAVGLVVLAIVRSFGTVVQTGQTGVLFFWGRVRKTLEPGFHPLIPIVHAVRKVPTRSITRDLPRQRVTTADGLVYDVDSTVVYRAADPVAALTRVDDLARGVEAVLALALQEVVRRQTRQTVVDRKTVEPELAELAGRRLEPWGVVLEQAGLTTIAPTRETLRLTQLRLLAAERLRVIARFSEAGLPTATALALIGSPRKVMGKSAARYRLRVKVPPAPPEPPAATAEVPATPQASPTDRQEQPKGVGS
jgi:regulator of protease activity HflC (stomatin/prohibitin superfamily)